MDHEADKQDILNGYHPDFSFMFSTYWNLTDTLSGGTSCIRAKGETFLPKYEKESAPKYNIRLSRTFLDPFYKDTIDRHAGRPFSQPVQVKGLTDLRLASIEEDANLEGEELTSFSKGLFKSSEDHGLSYVLVDMPAVMVEEGQERSLGGDIDQNIRPKFIHIKAPCLTNWGDEIINNKRTLSWIVYRDEGYRYFWSRERWECYRSETKEEERERRKTDGTRKTKNSSKVWRLQDEGANNLGKIPLVVQYFNRKGFLLAEPPLFSLAEQNLKYYQNQSDQDSIEQFARTGTYFSKGFNPKELESLSIGPNQVVNAQSPNADFKVVEYGGTSVKIGQESLDKMQGKMELLGLKPEIEKSVSSTATGIIVNEQSASTDVKVWACVTESTLKKCYGLAAEWIKETLPDDFDVKVYKDFSVVGNKQDVTLLLEMAKVGKLSMTTLINEAKTRGVLDGAIDTEEEVERANGEFDSVPFNDFQG